MVAARGFTIPGPAGQLECILDRPRDARRFAVVVCHPHPVYGGTMHNKVIYRTAKTLCSHGGTTLRFNFRGAGLSTGPHDSGVGEVDDVATALAFLRTEAPGLPLALAGYSFGAWVGLRAGAATSDVTSLLGIGLASMHDFDALTRCPKPKTIVQGSADNLGPLTDIEPVVARFMPPTDFRIIPGADHFFADHHDQLQDVVASFAHGLTSI